MPSARRTERSTAVFRRWLASLPCNVTTPPSTHTSTSHPTTAGSQLSCAKTSYLSSRSGFIPNLSKKRLFEQGRSSSFSSRSAHRMPRSSRRRKCNPWVFSGVFGAGAGRLDGAAARLWREGDALRDEHAVFDCVADHGHT